MKAKLVLAACLAVTALIVAYAVYATATYPRWTVDDAFILFRYADNLATHGELNWNVGEDPVEGYTGVTLVVLLTIAIKLGISPVAAAHVIGVVSFFVGAALIVLILRGINVGSATALALYFTAPFMYTHAWSGLETTLFASATLFSIYMFMLGRRGLFLFSILLLSFTRPEGVPLAILLFIMFRPFSYRSLLIFVVPLLAYFVLRWAYYGRLLPNTYYAKKASDSSTSVKFLLYCIELWIRNPSAAPYSGSQSATLMVNLMEFGRFFKEYLLRPAIVAFALISWAGMRRSKLLAAAVAAFCAIVLFTYLPFKLMMNFSHRFLALYFPLAVLGLGAILKATDSRIKLIVALVLLIIPQVRMNALGMKEERTYTSTYKKLLEEAHIPIGRYLRTSFSPDQWLVVYADAGAIPYYSGMKTVDFGRLNDTYLAGRELSAKKIADYFYSRNAAALVITKEPRPSPVTARELQAILDDPRLGSYVLVGIYGAESRAGYNELLYVRNDLFQR